MSSVVAFSSWGGVVQRGPVSHPAFVDDVHRVVQAEKGAPVLAAGNGRSYGDSCLNGKGRLLVMGGLDRLIRLDPGRPSISAETGVTIGQLLQFLHPRGFTIPVVPGTQHVTIGGAIANDVHGKDSAASGSFGNWVRSIRLLRTSGEVLDVVPGQPLFHATIGGLGITGIILAAEISLAPLQGNQMLVRRLSFRDLSGMWDAWDDPAIARGASVAWLDLRVRRLSGVLTTGAAVQGSPSLSGMKPWKVPSMRVCAVNAVTIGLVNGLQHVGAAVGKAEYRTSYRQFHFPLDGLSAWNRLFGKLGLVQYQCVVPEAQSRTAIANMLNAVIVSGVLCSLAVIKRFGDVAPVGMLSFPLPGYSLAMDFIHGSTRLKELLLRCDATVLEVGGRIYPAKDSRMSPNMFRAGYTKWRDFSGLADPGISSDFWTRVNRDT